MGCEGIRCSKDSSGRKGGRIGGNSVKINQVARSWEKEQWFATVYGGLVGLLIGGQTPAPPHEVDKAHVRLIDCQSDRAEQTERQQKQGERRTTRSRKRGSREKKTEEQERRRGADHSGCPARGWRVILKKVTMKPRVSGSCYFNGLI